MALTAYQKLRGCGCETLAVLLINCLFGDGGIGSRVIVNVIVQGDIHPPTDLPSFFILTVVAVVLNNACVQLNDI